MADYIWEKLRKRPEQAAGKGRADSIPIEKISPNPFQPREVFEEKELKRLAESIKRHGVLQPIVVTKSEERPDEYILVVGERRLRASKLAGLLEIPAVISSFSEQELAEMALVENLQRKNLSPIEEAKAYRDILDSFGITQAKLGEEIGKSQSSIANKLRLLTLPEEVQECISREIISERHGRLLLNLPDSEVVMVLKEIVDRGLTVKQTEALVNRVINRKRSETKEGKVVRIFKDARLFRNSVMQLVKEMKAGGLDVEVTEAKDEDNYRITIDISKNNRRLV